jgi:CRISPR-associated endonuclease/helicase Cas3
MSINLTHFWAKSYPEHPLWRHCLDVAAVARALQPRFGPVKNLAPGWLEFLCATHDVGKCDRHFQNKDDKQAEKLITLGFPLEKWRADDACAHRKFRHESRSAEWLLTYLQSQHGWSNGAAAAVSKAILGHHGNWNPLPVYRDRRNLDSSLPWWNDRRDELGALLWETIAPEPLALDKFDHAGASGVQLAAYVVFADWIASNDKLFPYTELKEMEPRAYYEAACRLAQDVVAQMKLDAPAPLQRSHPPLFGEVWPERKDSPRPMQSALEERRFRLPPGLAIIEAPTGEGKTEAAIYLSQIWGRFVYFCLPSQATANDLHRRFVNFLSEWDKDVSARLMHGMAWLGEETESVAEALETLPQLEDGENSTEANQQARAARNWLRPMRRAMLAPHGVGTIDQALLSGLRVKFGPLRLLGLTGKTLVIDEVHSYDEFMSTLLERLLQWCRALEVNVILLSATLSRAQRLDLSRAYAGPEADLSALEVIPKEGSAQVAYPLLSFVPRQEKAFTLAVGADPDRARQLRIELKTGFLTDVAATAKLAVDTVAEGGCLCVLINTVATAQDVFRSLQTMQAEGKISSDTQLHLFHARFPARRRKEIEDEVVALFGPDAGKGENLPRPARAILIATQVVEQSLDVSFDWMISQIAPIDLLLQRAGRLWRHDWHRLSPYPTLVVLTPSEEAAPIHPTKIGRWFFGASGKVYQPEILLRTLAVLHRWNQWNLPRDYRKLIEMVYDREANLGEFASQDGFLAALEKSILVRDEAIKKSRSEADINVWIEPQADNFDPMYGTQSEAEEDDAARTNKYFVARTRMGDESVSLFALTEPQHFQLAEYDKKQGELPRQQQRPPSPEKLKDLFQQKVGAPYWWFYDRKTHQPFEPLQGYKPLQQGAAFARGQLLVPFGRSGDAWKWEGLGPDGPFSIVFHPDLGLLREALPSFKNEFIEADAGYTS